MAIRVVLVAALLAAAASADWVVVQNNIMSVAFGVAGRGRDVYVTGGEGNGAGRIFHSNDGFATFEAKPHDPQLMYMSVDISPNGNGIAGSLGFYNQVAPGSFAVDATGDWIAASGNNIFSAAQSVIALNNNSYYMVGFFMPSITNYLNGVLSSSDAGQSWKYTNWNQPESTQARYGAILTENVWIIAGGAWPAEEKQMIELRQTWHSQHFSYEIGGNGKRIGVQYHGPSRTGVSRNQRREGYEAAIVRTADGGQTFTRVFEDLGRFYFNGISCLRQRCWVVGEGDAGAWIYGSTDGGATWFENSFHAGIGLFNIEFSDENNGWAVGGAILENTFDAVFLRTTDGGRTWIEELPRLRNAYPNDITVIDTNTAYATAFLRNGLSSVLGYRA